MTNFNSKSDDSNDENLLEEERKTKEKNDECKTTSREQTQDHPMRTNARPPMMMNARLPHENEHKTTL
ncbi:hypothetical protein C2G38_2162462 [Gigaspora rosea]|uniref:Uncharacterized protein n=1 Tax=Gigaspora rosea TaxID=44941 RepID=A0A397VW89_9GLOM|nr:hypothetical protein C2G38_2162462 [Gigaspora rosea]